MLLLLTSIDWPFDARAISTSHSALTGVMAGFALAALFLLIDHTRASQQKNRGRFSKAMLLLFVSFLTGSICSYLYSALTGETEARAYILFTFPSGVIAIHVFMLMAGINFVFRAFEIERQICLIAQRISFLVIGFCVLMVGQDSFVLCGKLGGAQEWFTITSLSTTIAVLTLVVSMGRIRAFRRPISRAFPSFCYVALLSTLAIAVVQGVHFSDHKEDFQLSLITPYLMFLAILVLGGWTLLVLDSDAVRFRKKPRRTTETLRQTQGDRVG